MTVDDPSDTEPSSVECKPVSTKMQGVEYMQYGGEHHLPMYMAQVCINDDNGNHQMNNHGGPDGAEGKLACACLVLPNSLLFLSEYEPSVTPSPANVRGLPLNQLREALQRQLEYYFSSENLVKDKYLLSKMDNDKFVNIDVVANFEMVKRLTNDFDLVVDVLRSSNEVDVDESGLKVRPNCTRRIVILRDVPESIKEDCIYNMFAREDSPVKLAKIEMPANNTWYLYFHNGEDAQAAISFLKETLVTYPDTTFPILARVKAKPIVTIHNRVARQSQSPHLSISQSYPRQIGLDIAHSPGESHSSRSPAVSPVSSVSGSVPNPVLIANPGLGEASNGSYIASYPSNVPILADSNPRVMLLVFAYSGTNFDFAVVSAYCLLLCNHAFQPTLVL